MEEEFRALLLADADIVALCAGRVGFGERTQGQPLPALVLNVVGGAETMTLQGPNGLLSSRMQVDCYAASYAAAKVLSRVVLTVLNGHRGGGFRLIESVAIRDGREGGSNEADRPFRVSLDFLTHWRA
jgi:hypothetical protein